MSFYKKLRSCEQEYIIVYNYYNASVEHTYNALTFIINRLRTLRKTLKDLKKQVTNECKETYKKLTENVKTLIESVENDITIAETNAPEIITTGV